MKLLDRVEISRMKINSLFCLKNSDFPDVVKYFILTSQGIWDNYTIGNYRFHAYNLNDNRFEKLNVSYFALSTGNIKVYLIQDGDSIPFAKSKK